MIPPADGWPLVSCIMPTWNRRRFVPDAIRYFIRQDFPNKELVIVDDGNDDLGDLIPDDPCVRYIRINERATVGTKRNIACERSAGSLIAHWDDDDWHSPRRLRCQVQALLEAGAEICGLKTMLYLDARNGKAWRYAHPDGPRPWLAGNSLLYTRDFWARRRFPRTNVGEDAYFVWGANPRRMVALDDFTVHVGFIHDQNVASKPIGAHGWLPHPVEEIRQLLGEDWRPDGGKAEEVGFGSKTVLAERTVAQTPPAFAAPEPVTVRNVFACLVHENIDCVIDLVRNLRHLDPTSTILLYNGSQNPMLLKGTYPFERQGVIVHPHPRPMQWGRLHDFALDCMRFALEQVPFDTLTIVDSDQLALRPGYSARLGEFLADEQGVGMLGNCPEFQGHSTRFQPAMVAHAEIDRWRPYLRRFPDGEAKFVYWSFWPSTVFTAEAARALVEHYDGDEQIRQLLCDTKVWATEEVVLPTLVALLGFRIARNPCSYDYVRYRTPYTVYQIENAMSRADVFWAHPVPRRLDDPLRAHVRERFQDYASVKEVLAPEAPPPFLLSLPILTRMRRVEGWLTDEEADVLIGATADVLTRLGEVRAIVEVGSYCGRGTVVLASVVKAVRPSARVWSVDPHEGKLGTAERSITVPPSLEKLTTNLAAAGVSEIVQVLRASAPEVRWSDAIALLLIDGLHDYASVARDFAHFAPWVAAGGYVAFHDYASYFPGVVVFVDTLMAAGEYQKVHSAGSLIVLRKQEVTEGIKQ